MNRHELISQAVDQCLKELYSFAHPTVTWNEFIEQNKLYSKSYKEWEAYNSAFRNKDKDPDKWEKYKKLYEKLDWENKSITECIGPKPCEFYYLPEEILKDICDSYIYSYRLDQKQELLDTIEILKNYCKEPIVDKYIKGKGNPGDEDFEPEHRGYEHPKSLKEQIKELLGDIAEDNDYYPNRICEKFFEFLDMAGNFFNWNRDLNTFNVSVYLGPSPNFNKGAVIENWKKYRNKDIEINDEQIKKEYYGEDDFDE